MEKIPLTITDAFQKAFNQNGNNSAFGGELYSVERLEQFAAAFASEQKEVNQPKTFQKLLPRLKDNQKVLVAAYKLLINNIENESSISPAAEWLVDNFYIVEEQLLEIQVDLPVGFYRELPKLKNGAFIGYPRIYAIAVMMVAHTDSRLEVETLERFLTAYQKVTPLNIGELWAFAITLRFALVENLRRLTSRIITSREEREEADSIADKLIELAAKQPENVLPIFIKRFSRVKRFGSAFIEQLTRRLRDQDYSIATVYEWLENQLQELDTSIERVVQTEYQNQAAAQITVGNIITSMRLLSTIDWNAFFEKVSLIETILQTDSIYPKMNFLTRNRYRKVIERIAKRTQTDELEVAKRVVEIAEKARQKDPLDQRHSHIGYYLIDKGLAVIEQEFAYHPHFSEYLNRLVLRFPTIAYLGLATFLTLLLVTLLVTTAAFFGASLPVLIAFGLLSIIPASDLALSIANWDFSLIIPPRVLPQMETTLGIPENAKTMVVIPTILSSEAVAAELLEKLEIYHLANKDNNIFFGLLGDFADASTEETERDSAILEFAQNKINELNDLYSNKFYLFHRRRQWNESEGKWMGWERKRGKLEEFNSLLCGAKDTSFFVATAENEFLKQIVYVITLDSDTQLTRDSARKLIGIAEHPLNRPYFDEKLQRVTKGYGILQPRISISLLSASSSYFTRILSGNKGIDPYTTASSDIYQDLFAEGSFTGKGLYVVDAFAKSLKDRVAENTILSHDLFEGIYARCALVTDIEFLDDFPTHYNSFVQRSHRWVRGDWQISEWIFPTIKNARGEKQHNDLSIISRWKILDNLRRSLVAPTIFLWLLAVWTIIPGSAFFFTLFILLEVGFPIYAHLQQNLLAQPRGLAWTSHLWSVWGDFRTNTLQVLFSIIAIPNQAYSKLDAIIRTIYRKNISRKNLLEWKTAAKSESENLQNQSSYLRQMWVGMLLSVIGIILVVWLRPRALPIALPFLLAWFLFPMIAYRISLAPKIRRFHLPEKDIKMARMIARRTWRFFETFVGDNDNWLPPDNFQEDPEPKIAHRTSPTNIGLLLLSTISAYDFGYIGTLELSERLGFTFGTLEKLEKYRGHFFNWYDTQTLAPLNPRYISTVDSGNLAG
ncbi:MAG TPA: hypothetical protein PKY82_18835, partial [Pyrinomonadaceae bacterium]|nr:hypothetical protein [Pyrinomonadaceae bacterium]